MHAVETARRLDLKAVVAVFSGYPGFRKLSLLKDYDEYDSHEVPEEVASEQLTARIENNGKKIRNKRS